MGDINFILQLDLPLTSFITLQEQQQSGLCTYGSVMTLTELRIAWDIHVGYINGCHYFGINIDNNKAKKDSTKSVEPKPFTWKRRHKRRLQILIIEPRQWDSCAHSHEKFHAWVSALAQMMECQVNVQPTYSTCNDASCFDTQHIHSHPIPNSYRSKRLHCSGWP